METHAKSFFRARRSLASGFSFSFFDRFSKKEIYESVGLDHKWVAQQFIAGLDRDEVAKTEMKQQNNIFRVLVKTLLKAHIITDRTKATYAEYVDMDELHQEDDEVAGTDIAKQLQQFNATAAIGAQPAGQGQPPDFNQRLNAFSAVDPNNPQGMFRTCQLSKLQFLT